MGLSSDRYIYFFSIFSLTTKGKSCLFLSPAVNRPLKINMQYKYVSAEKFASHSACRFTSRLFSCYSRSELMSSRNSRSSRNSPWSEWNVEQLDKKVPLTWTGSGSVESLYSFLLYFVGLLIDVVIFLCSVHYFLRCYI